MNTKKKLLSLFTAVAMTVSAFTGLVIPANAENNDPNVSLMAVDASLGLTTIAANYTFISDTLTFGENDPAETSPIQPEVGLYEGNTVKITSKPTVAKNKGTNTIGGAEHYNSIRLKGINVAFNVAAGATVTVYTESHANRHVAALTSTTYTDDTLIAKGDLDTKSFNFTVDEDTTVYLGGYNADKTNGDIYLGGFTVTFKSDEEPTTAPTPEVTDGLDLKIDMTNQDKADNTTHKYLTAEETAAAWTNISDFGIDAQGNRVAADSEDAVMVFSGFKWHSSDNGIVPGTLTIKVPGPVKISVGNNNNGNEVTVSDGNGYSKKANISTAGNRWNSTDTDRVVDIYYGGEATTLTVSGGGYVPYYAVKTVDISEVPKDTTASFKADSADNAIGAAPEDIVVPENGKLTFPANKTYYKEGYTFTGWKNGDDTYTAGQQIDLPSDKEFTAVFTANTKTFNDIKAPAKADFSFRRDAGAPLLKVGEGTTGYLVGQVTIDGETQDVLMTLDATDNGKVNNSAGMDYAQTNKNSKFIVPAVVGTVIEFIGYDTNTTLKVGENEFYGSDSSETEKSYTVTENDITDGAVTIVKTDKGGYMRSISVTYPVTETPEETGEPVETTEPSADPTGAPSADPTEAPSTDPTGAPSADPTGAPSTDPTGAPSADPTGAPSADPTGAPSTDPTGAPSADPTVAPTAEATQNPLTPVAPVWEVGGDANADATFSYITYEGKSNVLFIDDKNVIAKVNNVSTGIVNFNTNVYIDPAKRNFRILLDSNDNKLYDASKVIAQAATNDTDGKVYVGPGTGNNGSGTELFTPASAGWYNIDITMDYSKVGTNDFITIVASDNTAREILGTQKIGANADVATSLKAIRLMATANDAYFADMQVTPGSALAPVATSAPTAEPTTAPTADPSETEAPYEYGKVLYTQDYESAADTGWEVADVTPTLETANGSKYALLTHIADKNSRGNNLNFGNLPAGHDYAIEFDLSLKSNTDQTSNFAIKGQDFAYNSNNIHWGAGSGYILKMNANKTTETWTLNDSDDSVTVTAGKFYHYKVATKGTAAYLTIMDGETPVVENKLLSVNGVGGLTGLYWLSGRSASVLGIDNIVVRNLNENELPDTKYYTLTVNTTRYATMKYGDTTLYADVNGKIEIPLLNSGTEINYTLSKTGYKPQEGTVTIDGEDVTVDKALEVIESGDGEKTIYFESDFGNANGAFVTNAGDRGAGMALGTVNLPDLATVSIKWNVDKAEEGQVTWVLKNASGAIIVGLQGITSDGSLMAFTGWSGNAAYNQYDDINKGTNIVKIADNYIGDMDISFVIDNKNQAVTVSCGTVSQSLPIESGVDASTIASMSTGKYRQVATLKIDDVSVTEPDPMYMSLVGISQFAKIAGKTVTQNYSKTEAVITPDETFTWTVDRSNEITKKGAKFTLASAPAEDMTAKAIVGAYNKGALKSLKIADVAIKAGQTEVFVEETANNAKVMLWKSIESMEPLAPVGTVQEYTEKVEGEAGMDGISIDPETGVLTVTDEAVPGYVTVTATGSTGKTASMTVEIKDFANVTATVDGPKAYEAGQTGKYVLTSLVDEYRANVIDIFTPSFASDNTDVITIDAATGVATAVAAGTANITVTVGNPGKEATVTIPVTVAAYSVVAEATGDSTVVDISNVKEDSAITGYQVTTATADGAKVNQTTVAKADVADNKITADTTGAAKVEVAPVYETKINTVMNVPAGSYNVTVTANNGRRTDVYVNDQMMFNNINQGGDNWVLAIRNIAESTDYTVNDVVVSEGYAKFNLRDDQSSGSTITNVKFVKSPSIVTRATRIYVIGDSLVANYHGTAPEGKEGFVRTGWGQVLQSYIKDAEVTNLGNSGAWATGMYGDAFTNVQQSAQPGDIVIWESGYNDGKHGGADPMVEAMTKVANECEELGVKVFFVTPNASWHDYKENVALSANVRTLAESLDNVTLIDLAKESYGFLSGRYGAIQTAAEDATDEEKAAINAANAARQLIIVGSNDQPGYYNNATWDEKGAIQGDKGLHSTFNAANCWAAIVANNLLRYDDTKNYVDTGVKHTFNDTISDVAVDAATIVTAQPETPAE